MVILDVVLMALVSVVIVLSMTWSICTQYRDPGCGHLRLHPRLPVKVGIVRLDEPSMTVRDVRTSA